MKKTMSICFFAALAAGGALLAAWTSRIPAAPEQELSPTEQQFETELTTVPEQWEVAESMAVREAARYVIAEQDGFLVVYEADGITLYLETGIRVEQLDLKAQEAIRARIYIRDERELYDLLESYSS